VRKVVFTPTDFTLTVRRHHCPGARWDKAARCWWMSSDEADDLVHALNEESQCRLTISIDGKPILVGATNWMANYHRAEAARPVPEDSVDRSRRLRAQWRAEALQDAA
jgi:hypothetical protein